MSLAVPISLFQKFLKIPFSHEYLEELNVWRINDAHHWRGDAAFFDEDRSPKPALEKYKRLVFDDWWTNASETTDDEGSTPAVRAFKGEYEITATVDGESTTKYVTVSDDATTVEIDVTRSYQAPEAPDVDRPGRYRREARRRPTNGYRDMWFTGSPSRSHEIGVGSADHDSLLNP